jgi:signal transduction histidine kinase
MGYRAITTAPLLREGVAIGAIAVARKAPGALNAKHLDLLKTFADQAVIAIENVRLFNETKEALERQTATAEILKVIASSPADVQPVFNAILRSAVNLCGAEIAAVFPYDGKLVHLGATHNWSEDALKYFSSVYPAPPSPALMSGRTILAKSIVKLVDAAADGHYDPNSAATGHWRRMLGVPMLREGQPLGALVVCWREPGETPQRQVDLLQTFADQAVIAIENVRLFNETREALERQTATAEILKVIASSPSDVQPVFDAIAQAARRLVGAFSVAVLRLVGDQLHLAALTSTSPAGDEALRRAFPRPVTEMGASRIVAAIRTRLPQAIADLQNDPKVSENVRAAARARGFRGSLAVPMLLGGEAVGVINVTRSEAGYFSDHQIELLKTFADQAVIAIENVRLFKELDSRTEALTKSVGQLTALGEVGQAISSSLDLETVLKTIVSRAVQLTGLDGGSIYEYDERAEEFHLRATENVDEEYLAVLRTTPIRKGEGAVGRAALAGEPVQIPDVQDGSYKSRLRDALIRAGYRAVLVVPLRREEHVIGALSVTRKTSGAFAPEIVELLKTFATQSAMAIQNARLFREIAEKGKELELASQHKSNFLASMSHELRTPLNAILGFNEMILGQVYGEVPADMQEPLADIQTSGKHLLRLINNVLDLAKIEAGRMELSLQDYSVHDTVASVHATLRPLAAEKGLEFLATIPNDVPLAYGDGGRIAQCLMNLAGNSLKFTKAGKVEISVEVKAELLVYKVSDTGIGIAPDKIDSLFTEFKQTDATIASEYGGTGLGLSISKKFVEMHGGRIWIESELGKGSAFIIEVPLRVKTP